MSRRYISCLSSTIIDVWFGGILEKWVWSWWSNSDSGIASNYKENLLLLFPFFYFSLSYFFILIGYGIANIFWVWSLFLFYLILIDYFPDSIYLLTFLFELYLDPLLFFIVYFCYFILFYYFCILFSSFFTFFGLYFDFSSSMSYSNFFNFYL